MYLHVLKGNFTSDHAPLREGIANYAKGKKKVCLRSQKHLQKSLSAV